MRGRRPSVEAVGVLRDRRGKAACGTAGRYEDHERLNGVSQTSGGVEMVGVVLRCRQVPDEPTRDESAGVSVGPGDRDGALIPRTMQEVERPERCRGRRDRRLEMRLVAPAHQPADARLLFRRKRLELAVVDTYEARA